MPLVETKASGSAQAYGFTSLGTDAPFLIDQLMDFIPYTGTGSAQNISTNLVDLSLSGGGMVWIKNCSGGGFYFFDTKTGVGKYYSTTTAAVVDAQSVTAFGAKTVSLGTSATTNGNGVKYLLCVFKQRVGFFDFQTYTGNGTNRTISHDLGYAPSFTLVLKTGGTGPNMYHQSNVFTSNTNYRVATSQTNGYPTVPSATYMTAIPSASSFFMGTSADGNENAVSYVAWLFGEAAIFGPNKNEKLLYPYKYPNTSFNFAQTLMNNPNRTYGFCMSFGDGGSTASGFNHPYTIADSTVQNGFSFYGATTAFGATFSTIVTGQKLNQGSTSGSNNGIMVIGMLQQQTSGVELGAYAFPAKGMTFPPSGNNISYYVGVSGTSQQFIVPFDWDLILYHVDGVSGGDQWIARANQPNSAGSLFTGNTYTSTAASQTNKSVSNTVTSIQPQGCFGSVGTAASGGVLNRLICIKLLAGRVIPWVYRGDGVGSAAQTINHNFGGQPDALVWWGSNGNGVTNYNFPNIGTNTAGSWTAGVTSSNTTLAYNVTATQMTFAASFNLLTVLYNGIAFFNLANVVGVGTYTGTGAVQTITISGWSTTPSSILIISNQAAATNANLIVGSLGATDSVTWSISSGTSSTANATDATISRYISGSNYGFQVSAASIVNVSARVYYYIALK